MTLWNESGNECVQYSDSLCGDENECVHDNGSLRG